jgi:hypothetical protein
MARGPTDDGEVGERAADNHDPTYTVGSLIFTSPMHLPELVAHPGRPRFVRHSISPPRRMTAEESAAFVDDDRAEFLVTTRSAFGGVRFHFPRLAAFAYERISEHLQIAYPTTTTEETVRHLLLDHVLPRLMVHERGVVLHASVVVKDGQAIAFLGPSGAGKSTLATTLSQRGFTILADDALVLGSDERGVTSIPMYPGVRLYPADVRALVGDDVGEHVAHYTDKLRVDARGLGDGVFGKKRAPLVRLYVLERGDAETFAPDVFLGPISSKDALFALLGSTFRVDVTDDEESARLFANLSRPEILSRCRRLRVPHRRDSTADVQTAIERDLGALPK